MRTTARLLLSLVAAMQIGADTVTVLGDINTDLIGFACIPVESDHGGTPDHHFLIVDVESDDEISIHESVGAASSWPITVDLTSAIIPGGLGVWNGLDTPGSTDRTIYVTWINTTNERVEFRSFNPEDADNVLSAIITIEAETSCLSQTNGTLHTAITMARSGRLYVVWWCDAAGEKGVAYSDDQGQTWLPDADSGGPEAHPCSDDTLCFSMLFPASGTGDDDDVVMFYHEPTADDIFQVLFDASATAGSEWTTPQTIIPTAGSSTTCGSGISFIEQYTGVIIINPYDAAINFTNCTDCAAANEIVLCGWTATSSTADLCCYVCDSADTDGDSCDRIDDVPTQTNLDNAGWPNVVIDNISGSSTEGDIWVSSLEGTDTTRDVVYWIWDESADTWASKATLVTVNDDIRRMCAGFTLHDVGGKWMPCYFNDDLNDIFCPDTEGTEVDGTATTATEDYENIRACGTAGAADLQQTPDPDCDETGVSIEGSHALRMDANTTADVIVFYDAIVEDSEDLYWKGCVNIDQEPDTDKEILRLRQDGVDFSTDAFEVSLITASNNLRIDCGGGTQGDTSSGVYVVDTTFQFTVHCSATTRVCELDVDGVEEATCNGSDGAAGDQLDGFVLLAKTTATTVGKYVWDNWAISTASEPADRTGCAPAAAARRVLLVEKKHETPATWISARLAPLGWRTEWDLRDYRNRE